MPEYKKAIIGLAVELYMEREVMRNYRTCMRLARTGHLSDQDKIDMIDCANHWIRVHDSCEDILRSQ